MTVLIHPRYGVWVALCVASLACDSSKEAGLAARVAQLEEEKAQQAIAARESDLSAKQSELAAREAAVAQREQTAVPVATAPQAAQPARPAAGAREVAVGVEVQIEGTKPTGKAWDVAGGAPDPVVTITVQRSGATESYSAKDKMGLTAGAKFSLQPGDKLHVNVVDKDAMAADPIGDATFTYRGRAETQSVKLIAGTAKINFGG